MRNIQVSAAFANHLFYKESDVIKIKEELSIEDVSSVPFLFDIVHSHGISLEIKPWESRKESVKQIILVWTVKREEISILHKQRNKEKIMKEMPSAIALYINLLFWINGQPVTSLVNLESDLEELTWKPVNIAERLSFIMNRPFLYHSFVQLSELFTEMEKMFEKVKIKEKL
ncbi:YpoC family protein [Bacillus alkalisoli]|uniref:YpoC family protein n=1 Tax=Bacillus alkalisoli TaxID=2011008 RepID=UPI000C24118C|nr:hypothetical protein [Bacillus alkalisoli]